MRGCDCLTIISLQGSQGYTSMSASREIIKNVDIAPEH